MSYPISSVGYSSGNEHLIDWDVLDHIAGEAFSLPDHGETKVVYSRSHESHDSGDP